MHVHDVNVQHLYIEVTSELQEKGGVDVQILAVDLPTPSACDQPNELFSGSLTSDSSDVDLGSASTLDLDLPPTPSACDQPNELFSSSLTSDSSDVDLGSASTLDLDTPVDDAKLEKTSSNLIVRVFHNVLEGSSPCSALWGKATSTCTKSGEQENFPIAHSTATLVAPDADPPSQNPHHPTEKLPASPIPDADPPSQNPQHPTEELPASPIPDALVDECPSTPPSPRPVNLLSICNREVAQEWPRDPNGKGMNLSNISELLAENSPNQYPWCASMEDIYFVQGDDRKHVLTGSALVRWMEENGETDFAAEHISLARKRGPPKRLEVFPHDQVLQREEDAIRSRAENSGTPVIVPESTKTELELTSPWPLVPFSYRPEKLQMKIPVEQLPQRLIVHDPWNVLEVENARKNRHAEWSSCEDSTLVYKLQSHPMKAEKLSNPNTEMQSFIINIQPSDPSPGDLPIDVRVLHDPPPTVEPAHEAHVDCVTEDIQRTLKTMECDGEKGVVPRQGSGGTAADPIHSIKTSVPWQDVSRPTCNHLKSNSYVPLTARVRVVAKLSNDGDSHLSKEARNYQNFEAAMFEHWSGLSLVPDIIQDPVPLGAIVPQYYGYYEPEDAFLYSAGWVHGSPYERNIVMQPGPLYLSPEERLFPEDKETRNLSFRLIDFGRSYYAGVDTCSEMRYDRRSAKEMFLP
ncbi:hypothetical protein C0991_000435 [Blastosporella zonata]|nr:hypothetical protein C0991_000435 [Blastosporella zonata]